MTDFDNAVELDRSRRWLRGRLLSVAEGVYPTVPPVVEHDAGPAPVEAGPDDQPAWQRCSMVVTTGAPRPPWDAADAVARAGELLGTDGWTLQPPRHEGDRYEVVAERDGFLAVAGMLQGDGILRLSGRTPARLLPPAGPGRPDAAGPVWRPANDVEQGLVAALEQGEYQFFFEQLVDAPLYLPVPAGLPAGAPAPVGTVTVGGTVHLAAYTSPETMARGTGDASGSWRRTDYRSLLADWPNPAWRLALNDGTPLEVHLSPADLLAAVEGRFDTPEPTDPGASGGTDRSRTGPGLDTAMAEAIRRDDRSAVLDALAGAREPVWLLTDGPVPDRRALDHPDFPWLLDVIDGAPVVYAFTRRELATGLLGDDVHLAPVVPRDLAACWPDRAWRLALNPGSDLAVSVPGFSVMALAD